MLNKIRMVWIVILVLSLSFVYYICSGLQFGVEDIKYAYEHYTQVKNRDIKDIELENENGKVKLQEMTDELNKLRENRKIKYSEYEALTGIHVDIPFELSDDNLIKVGDSANQDNKQNQQEEEQVVESIEPLKFSSFYNKFVLNADENKVDIDRLYSYDTPGEYLVELTGTLNNITSVLYTVLSDIDEYDLSVGNISMRQDYDAYSLTRLYDDKTLQSWFTGDFINSDGLIVKIDDVAIEEETLYIPFEEELSSVTLDTEAMNREKDAVSKQIDREIKRVEAEYSNYASAINDFPDEPGIDKEAMLMDIEDSLSLSLESLENQRTKELANIEKKYEKDLESRKSQALKNMLEKERDNAKLASQLPDPMTLKYKCTVTLKGEIGDIDESVKEEGK